MRTLRDLLATWETWSAQNTIRLALMRAKTEEQRDILGGMLKVGSEVDPLDALSDMTELVTLLSEWRFQVVENARAQGATWSQISIAMDMSPHCARDLFLHTTE